MHLENLSIGDPITILRGTITHCASGCCRSEAYGALKGVPVVVLAVNAPYVAAGLLTGHTVVLDCRECEITKVSEEYLSAFIRVPGEPKLHPGVKVGEGMECQGK